ncbi:MAG: gamma-glutamyl-gamma-aminobutyrate hydrolase family protein [Chitinophagales bacterium]|nr:gamma-glutamyl-gamma-aminobutyrate hydrolase family protein [Chitinophagales bacterium]
MIKIAVSACFFYPDKSRPVFGHKTLQYFERDMARYLGRQQVMPIMIPDMEDKDILASYMDEMEGLVLQGGSDIAPNTYGEQPIENNRWPGDAYRDAYELWLIEMAMKRELPILGICRGFQLLNVYFGGTMYQDIASQIPHALMHRDAELYDQISHEIDLVEGTILQKLYADETSRRVNSVHHQAVKDLGKDLKVMAHSQPDGLIEAFTWTGAQEGKVMGVQWHPEYFHNFKQGTLMDAHKVYEHFLSFTGQAKQK